MSTESASKAKAKAVVAFLDESGHSSNTSFISIAGFMGYATTWADFDVRWKDALSRSGVPYLHMREFAHCRGAFEGWSEEKRRGLLGDLVEVICSVPIVPAGMVVRVDDFNDLPERTKKLLRDPFFLCLQETVLMLTQMVNLDHDFFGEIGVVFGIFSRQDEFGPLAARHWNAIKRLRGIGERMGTLHHADMKRVPGLQSADLIAYETRHFYHNRHAGKGTKRRWPLERILSHQREWFDMYLPTCQYICREFLLAYRGEGLSDEARRELMERLKPEILAMYE